MSFYFKYSFTFISFCLSPIISSFSLTQPLFPLNKNPSFPLSVINSTDYISLLNTTFNFLQTYSTIDPYNNTKYSCYSSLYKHITENGTDFFWNIFSFSGKGLSELGLESECKLSESFNFAYYLLLYNYSPKAFSTFTDSKNTFIFLNHSSFYTGICLIKECDSLIHDLFNRTTNPKLFSYLETNHSINNITYLTSNNTYQHTNTYEYTIFNIFCYITITLIALQIVLTLVHIFIYIPYKVSKKQLLASGTDHTSNEIEIDFNESEEFTQTFLRKRRKETNEAKFYSIFTKSTTTLDELNDISDGNAYKKKFLRLIENVLELFNVFSNLKLLTSKYNFYYNEDNIEIISFFRMIVILFMTMMQNMETIIKIPARDFSSEDFYTSGWFIFLKLASYSIECYIALDGFLMMYKFMFYIKTHTHKKVGNKISFSIFISFYLRIISKVIAFVFVFFFFSICAEYVLHFASEDSLYNYFVTKIYDNDVHDWLLQIIIPFYNFKLSYSTDTNYDKLFSYNRFITMYINQFYVFTFVIIIVFISFKLKSKLYDIIITLLFILNIASMWITCPSETYTDKDYYDLNKVIRGLFTIRHPHIMFNHFLIGVFSGLICFYHKDVISGEPINEQEGQYCPFKLCYNISQFIDSLPSICKSIWFYVNCLILIAIALNFKFILLITSKEDLLIEFTIVYRIIYYYEKTLFLLCFMFMVVLLQTNNEESSIKQLMSARVFTTIARIDLCYVSCLSVVVYGTFCLFNFQLKLSYQNLWFLSFGLFVCCFIISLGVTILIEVPMRILVKEIIEKLTHDDEEEGDDSDTRKSFSHKKKIK